MKVDDIKDYNFEKLPIGWYQVQITSEQIGFTKKNSRMIAFESIVVDGNFKDRRLWFKIFTSIKAMPFSKPFLKAMSFDGSKEIDEDENGNLLISADFAGRQLKVYVGGYEKYINKKGYENEKEVITAYDKAEKIDYKPKVDDEIPF